MIAVALGILGTRSEAEDATQEAMLRLFRKLPRVGSPRELRAYLCRLTQNEARRIRLARWLRLRRQPSHLAASRDRSSIPATQEREAHYLRVFETVQALVPRLTRRERQVFVLRALEELDYAEIASILAVTEVTVRRLYSLARQRMVSLLKDEHGIELDLPS